MLIIDKNKCSDDLKRIQEILQVFKSFNKWPISAGCQLVLMDAFSTKGGFMNGGFSTDKPCEPLLYMTYMMAKGQPSYGGFGFKRRLGTQIPSALSAVLWWAYSIKSPCPIKFYPP